MPPQVQVGPFRLLSVVGTGGMGTVFRAEWNGRPDELEVSDAPGLIEELASRTVAVKVTHPHLSTRPEIVKRALREAQVGRSVRHPNVVRTFMAGTAEVEGHSIVYLVMEFVEGQTVRQLAEELGGRLPEQLCRNIARAVAEGLTAIHDAGAVHLDLKPDNIVLMPDESVKIMDLGISTFVDETISASQVGSFVGSFRYAAPEQFRGQDEAEPRSDLYSLGAMLFELATGVPVFEEDDVRRFLHRALYEPPRRMHEVEPGVSLFFSEVVDCLLAKAPESRFASARELIDVLRAGEESPWWNERKHWTSRHPLLRIWASNETAVFGRDHELQQVGSIWSDVARGQGRVILVTGEAGVGKTRLLVESIRRAEDQGAILRLLYGCYPPGGAATNAGAFSAAFRSLGAPDLEALLREKVPHLSGLLQPFAAILRGDAPTPDMPALSKDALHTAFVELTRALARESPVVLWIDDLHFAPDEGLAVFAALAHALRSEPVLLVGTTRPGLSSAWLADMQRLPNTTALSLGRLDRQAVFRIIEEALGSEHLASDLLEQVYRKSDGNPFFVFELVRALREGNLVRPAPEGGWERTQVIRDLLVPDTVRELVRQRTTALDETDRDLLDAACCWGFEFDPLLVARALDVSTLVALKGLARLERQHGLVRMVGHRYVFDHHQIQEELYEGLFPAMRQIYHAALAEAFEDVRDEKGHGASTPGAAAAQLCHHFLEGDQAERARPYLETALDHLEAGYMHGAAADLVTRALARCTFSDQERVELLLRKAARLDYLGRLQEEIEVIEEAIPLAGSDLEMALRVKQKHASTLVGLGRYEEAAHRLEEILAAPELAAGSPLRIAARAAFASALFYRGSIPAAAEQYEIALADARAGGHRLDEARQASNLGTVLLHLGRLSQAMMELQACIQIGRDVGDLKTAAIASMNLTSLLLGEGRFDEALRLSEEAVAIGRSLGHRSLEAAATSNLGKANVCLGRLDQARSQFDRAADLHREIGSQHSEITAQTGTITILAYLGEAERARSVASAARQASRDLGARSLEAICTHCLGLVAETEGDLAQAESDYRRAVSLHEEVGDSGELAETLIAFGGVLLKQRRRDEATEVLRRALGLGEEFGLTPSVARARVVLLALLDGDPDAARDVLREHAALLPHEERMEAHYLVWTASQAWRDLDAAHLLLADLLDGLPEARRESCRRVALHRAILDAHAAAAQPE